ncbi:RibD C-terminal domain containing protein [Trichomonas vaginalis G3]|uniref:RibD C-terminal domain containing protein n=1 Tax=Trichomonas vaginalis (strain ATCC PRA-98 / G3) TaxID=412133 RepID=A2FMV9_TRIV3|nr:cupin domain-containing protein family [Trichomonas vaginalis G3]EAX93776.1 RibD C-terminal domain containing protein [Trichomonas vaginalis G3]KAI5535883.1 cupin domain-containing protein family [Trichomonas vaginalis G3]|eukprot:XP_001306706.1 RibD C-terminal domain containing protein [Trichomonas vaginalis G3]
MSAERPFIYIHMVTSLDGKIVGKFMETGNAMSALQDYMWTNALYKADGAMCGSKTITEMGYNNPVLNPEETEVPDGDFIAEGAKVPFLVVLDSTGKDGWNQSHVNMPLSPTTTIIEVLSEKASPQYRNYLRRLNISYIISGKEHVNIVPVVQKLKKVFGVNVLGILGGATVNWSVVEAGICDEVSICLSAVGDGANNSLTLFEKSPAVLNDSPV